MQEPIQVIKAAVDNTTIVAGAIGMAQIIGWINFYVPPVLLIAALIWWLIRYWEKLSGTELQNTKWARWLFRRK